MKNVNNEKKVTAIVNTEKNDTSFINRGFIEFNGQRYEINGNTELTVPKCIVTKGLSTEVNRKIIILDQCINRVVEKLILDAYAAHIYNRATASKLISIFVPDPITKSDMQNFYDALDFGDVPTDLSDKILYENFRSMDLNMQVIKILKPIFMDQEFSTDIIFSNNYRCIAIQTNRDLNIINEINKSYHASNAVNLLLCAALDIDDIYGKFWEELYSMNVVCDKDFQYYNKLLFTNAERNAVQSMCDNMYSNIRMYKPMIDYTLHVGCRIIDILQQFAEYV